MDFSLLFPLLLLVAFVPIFLSGRKQRRQLAEMQQMQRELEEGDIVVTTSGLRGVVVDVAYEDTIDLDIADGVVTTWVRAAIREKVVTGADAGADTDTDTDTTDDVAAATDDVPAAAPVEDATVAASTATGSTAAGSTVGDAPSLTKDDTPRS